MSYAPIALPFRLRNLPDHSVLGVSESGDYAFLAAAEINALRTNPGLLPIVRQAELKARFFIGGGSHNAGTRRLMMSRQLAKRETVQIGPTLHIIVPTLQCAHSCQYCQVSRSLDDEGYTMSIADLNAACDAIFQSPSRTLTVEFQGGDPLLRFDLIEHAIVRIKAKNETEGRQLRFVVASTLHQLSADMCEFFKENAVLLSTSIDGPAQLHNKNRPTPTRDAYEKTLAGVELARNKMGHESVSALMTTTRESLAQPEAIVDEYVRLGFRDIFIRPLSTYGFAKKNQTRQGYSLDDFKLFYLRALERVLHWNRQGVELREVYTTIILNKILSTFDAGYVDLQSPTGAGLSVVVYNYDGFVYPSDEARMLAETGDTSLRLGRIGESLSELVSSQVQRDLIQASTTDHTPGCKDCAYNLFCAPNPVDAQAQFGTLFAPVELTEHCRRHIWLFDTLFLKIRAADDWLLDLFYEWARPVSLRQE
jgi:His-Xaa-Ser system radical SAM maturase HxsB